MKKKNAVIFGLTAAALAFIMVLAGCPDSGGSSTGPSGPAYSGKFTLSGNAGSGDVVFELDDTGSSTSALSASRAAAGSKKLTGKLRDANGNVRLLSGSYDTSGAFNLSAGDDNLRYRISGYFGGNGKVLAANALVDKRTGTADNARLTKFEVEEENTGAIGGSAAAPANPLPEEFWGTWVSTEQSEERNGWIGRTKSILMLSSYSMSFWMSVQGTHTSGGKVELMGEANGGLLVQADTNPSGGYNVIFVVPGMETQSSFTQDKKDALNTAFQTYLTEKEGMTTLPTAILPTILNKGSYDALNDTEWTAGTTTKEYFVGSDGGVVCHNFSINHSAWLIEAKCRSDESGTITSAFIKQQIWIDNGQLKQRSFDGDNGSFATLADAQAATSQGNNSIMEFTRQ